MTLIPRCTYGPASSGVPLGPTVPTTAPSSTLAPRATATEPRCVSVNEYPSDVSIVTDLPFVGTLPAKLIVPLAGATTGSPVADAPMSMPRCCPDAYGCDSSKLKACSTGPLTGHVQACATGTQMKKAATIVVNLSNTARAL